MPFAEIDQEILLGLRSKPMSIYEISRRTGRAWRTIRDHLRRLKDLGKVERFDDGVVKLWHLKQNGHGVIEEQQIVGIDLMKITWNRVDARELMYYDKIPCKFRMPLIEEYGALLPLNLFEAFRLVLFKRFGHKMAETILFDIGREHALYELKKFSKMLGRGQQSLVEKLFERGVNLEGAKELFRSIYESKGWFKVISIEFGKHNVYKLKHTFESIAYSGAYPCSFIKGYLVGVIEALFHEKAIRYEELRCTSKGEDYCEFHIEVGRDIRQKFDFLFSKNNDQPP
ncbi:MAG: hypothetical protein ACETWM_13365 [Candidatus Lokiarchaeia archaeon]